MKPATTLLLAPLMLCSQTKASPPPKQDTLKALNFWLVSGYPSLHRNQIAGAGLMFWHKPAKAKVGGFTDLRILNSTLVDTGVPGESILRYSAPAHLRLRAGIVHWFSTTTNTMEGAWVSGWVGFYIPTNNSAWEYSGIETPVGFGGGISIGWLFPIGFNVVLDPAVELLVSQVEKVYGGVVLRYRLAVGWRWATESKHRR